MTSKAEKLLSMVENDDLMEMTPEQEDFADTVLEADVHMTDTAKLRDEIQRNFGESIKNEFMNLLIYGAVPQSFVARDSLREFFKNRRDLVSIACLEKLTDEKPEINITA